MLNKLSVLCFCFALMGLSGCITTTNAPQVDMKGAHDKRIILGQRYLAAGDRDKARWQYNKALELMRNSAAAYQGLAMLHQANGEMGPAEDQFQLALKYADKDTLPAVQMSYGQFIFERDESAAACEYFEQAANNFDFNQRAQVLYLAGKCAQKTGNPKRMVAALEHAVNLKPDLAPALLDLAEIYFQRAEYSKTKRYLDQFENYSKTSAKSIWLGIRIERIFGNKDKEASYVLALKNRYPYSKEYLAYRELKEQSKP